MIGTKQQKKFAWGWKKQSSRSVCTEEDTIIHEDRTYVDEKTQFRRAPNSSWLAGPLAGATSVYKHYPRRM
eukprot:scaffold67110_cov48-Cyclotella_meneghiniana.AAC.5